MKKFTKVMLVLVFSIVFLGFTKENVYAAVDQRAEQTIVNGVKEYKQEINISSYKVKKANMPALMSSVVYSHSDLFYIAAKYSYTVSNGYVVTVRPKYLVSKSERDGMQTKLNSVANTIKGKIESGMSQVDKALLVYNYIILNSSYDESGADITKTAYGVLVNGKGGCFGYSQAYNYIMRNVLGFECYVNYSNDKVHSWNTIKIDGQYYNCDVTWGDPLNDLLGNVWHRYFLITDDALYNMFRNAGWGWVGTLPYKSTSNKYSNYFFSKNVNSAVVRLDGKWYFVDKDANLCEGNTSNGSSTVKTSLQSAIGNITMGGNGPYCKIAVVNNKLYVCNNDSIFRVDIYWNSWFNCVRLNGVSVPYYQKIYGIANINGKLMYHVKYSAFSDVGTIKQLNV